LDVIFDLINTLFDLLNIHPAAELDVSCEQDLVWSELHGKQVAHLLDCRIGTDNLAKTRYSRPVRPLADEQCTALSAQQDSHRSQQDPD